MNKLDQWLLQWGTEALVLSLDENNDIRAKAFEQLKEALREYREQPDTKERMGDRQ